MKKNKSKKYINYLIAVFILIAIIFFIFSRKKEDGEIVYQVKRADLIDQLNFSGFVEAETKASLAFAAGGRVIKNPFHEGDRVKKGQVLAEIDMSGVRSGILRAKSQEALSKTKLSTEIEIARENLAKIKAEQDKLVQQAYQHYLSSDLQVYIADEDKKTTRSILNPKLSGAYNGGKEGKYRIEFYRSAANSGYSYRLSGIEDLIQTAGAQRPFPLGTKGLMMQIDSKSHYDGLHFIVPIPNTRSRSYQARKLVYEQALEQRERAVRNAQNHLDALIKKSNTTHLSNADAQIYASQKEIDAQILRLRDGKIIAPFDGYLVKNDLKLGETVNPFQPVITLFANKKKIFVLKVPEIYINKLHLGMPVNIQLDALEGKTLSGKITKIAELSELMNGVPFYRVELTFDKIDDRVKDGMNGKANIILFKKKNVLSLPKHFIFEKNAKKYVFLKKEKKGRDIIKREIELGTKTEAGLYEVTSGLKNGDLVVLHEDE